MNIISYYIPSLFSFNYNKLTNYSFFKKPKKDDIKRIKYIILDMDGVLRIGNKPITIARESFNYFTNNKNETNKICILTNECRKTPKFIKKELIIMGYNMTNVKIISASLIMLNYVRSILEKHNKDINIYLVVEESTYFYIKDNIKNEYSNANFFWIFNKNNETDLNIKIDYFIIGSINNNDKNIKIRNSLMNKKLTKLVTYNNESQFVITSSELKHVENSDKIRNVLLPSYIISLINAELSSEIIPYCPFKPNTNYLKENLESVFNIDIDKSEDNIIIIGDNINTNIKLGDNLNIKKGVVLTGITKICDLNYRQKHILDSIDYIVPDLSYFFY